MNVKKGKKSSVLLEIDKLEDELQRKSADKDFAVLDLHKFKVINDKNKSQYTSKQFGFANSYNRLMSETDELLKANLQTFICVAKDSFIHIASNSKEIENTISKLEKSVFERLHSKPLIFKKPLSIYPEYDFSYSNLNQLRQIHESNR